MPTFSSLPGDLTVEFIIGDEVNFVLDLDVDVTGYTFSAAVYRVASGGFQGGGGGFVGEIGTTMAVPTITVVNAAAGTLSWGLSETQTGQLFGSHKYRHFVRWVSPTGVTRTIVSGELLAKAP